MQLPTSIDDLSVIPGDNFPQGTDSPDVLDNVIRSVVSYVAALLGIGTFAGLVNIGVGLLSGCWLAYQLYTGIRYDLPIKRAKLAAALRNEHTKPGGL